MTLEKLNEKIVKCFCDEFQTIWLVDMKDLSMHTVYANNEISIPKSVDVATTMNSYELSRVWYIESYVVEQDRSRVMKQTLMDEVLAHTAGGKTYYVEYTRVFEGNVNYNQLCFNRVEAENGIVEYIMLGFRDIDVRRSADVDDMTGLLTRPAFFKMAEELLKNNPNMEFDIVISDIVDFKKINETYGIKTGDKILGWVGSMFAPYISEDLLVGRYGGDQMVIMGPHEKVVKNKFQDGLERFMMAEKRNGLPDIVMKFGVYENIQHDRSIISSCDKAHVALNKIKGHYEKILAFYDEKLISELDVQRRIENSMYDSLKNNDFKVYYQPKHDAVTGRLVGAEALIRWIHPEYGFMSPAQFIPLFENNGFVVEIDAFVWKRTCENLRRWEDKGIETVPVSVNASKLTFVQEELIKKLQVPVVENSISPKQLHLEITETLMTDDVDDLVHKLTAMRAIGYQIELDDFGAGYSSINILSSLPLDVVKLDMSFMKQFGDDKRAKVLAACINLAKELGYKTVSEGVELKEQKDVLGILGVDIIQGYYYSKPLSEEEFEAYMLKYSA